MPIKRKNILVLNYEFPPVGGGASYASYDLALLLSMSRNYSIDVVTMGFGDLPTFEKINEHLRVHRVKCLRSKKEICHPWEQLSYLHSAYKKCSKLISIKDYDLCHCHFIVPTGLLALKLKQRFGLNYILTSHGSDVLGYNKRFRYFYPLVGTKWRMVLDNALTIVTASHYLKKRILKVCGSLPESKVLVIPNLIRTSDIRPLSKDKTILIVSRLTKNKGIQDVLTAVREIDLKLWKVQIVGDGPYKKKLVSLAQKLGIADKVSFLGWVENDSHQLKQLYGRAAIFIMPSYFENMSITLLEAMQAGCAIVATKAGGNPEVLGQSAFFYPAGDSKSLSENLQSLISNSKLLKQLQTSSLSRQNVFSASGIISMYDNIIQKHSKAKEKSSRSEMRSKVSICFISRSAYPIFDSNCEATFGGAEADSYLLATELAKDKRFQIKFIVGDFGQKRKQSIESVEVIRGYHINSPRPVQLIKLVRRIVHADCDWYFQESASGGAGVIQLLCKLMGKRFLYRTASDIDCNGQYVENRPFEGRIYSYGIKHAEQVIAQNVGNQNELKTCFDIKSQVIRNAYKMPQNISKERRYILSVARSEKIKQPYIFLDLAKTFPEQKFLMICPRANFNSVDYQGLQEEAKKIKNITFLPGVKFSEINAYFAKAKLFVNTSDYEGFPNAFVQAMMHGVPICSLNVNPDCIITKNACGVFAAGDINKMEAGIMEIFTNKREYKAMCKNALEYARSNHDINIIIKQYKQIFLKARK